MMKERMIRRLRLGVAGLGRAFTLMLPTFLADDRVQLVAAADPRAEARRRFVQDFSPRVYDTVEELCADPEIEAVYVATPHQQHAAHVIAAARAGRHVLVEKPMAVTLAECEAMNAAARAAGVQVIVGHSHSFDAPYLRTRELIDGGQFGCVRMITALNYTDFLYRPRRPEELVTSEGGGVVFSQGAHQVDIVRLLGGGLVESVRASTGRWDPARPTEGAYAAHLTFAGGTFASAVYSGYAHFDSDEFCGWVGELGNRKDSGAYGAARQRLAAATSAANETALKNQRNYGGPGYVPPTPGTAPDAHQQFGMLLVSCERGDLRPLPNGIMIYGDREKRVEPLPPPTVPRREVIDELYATVVHGKAPVHSGEWSLATLEVCLAILESAKTGADTRLTRQVALPGRS